MLLQLIIKQLDPITFNVIRHTIITGQWSGRKDVFQRGARFYQKFTQKDVLQKLSDQERATIALGIENASMGRLHCFRWNPLRRALPRNSRWVVHEAALVRRQIPLMWARRLPWAVREGVAGPGRGFLQNSTYRAHYFIHHTLCLVLQVAFSCKLIRVYRVSHQSDGRNDP